MEDAKQRKVGNERKSMVTRAVTDLEALKQTMASRKVFKELRKVATPKECVMTRLLMCRQTQRKCSNTALRRAGQGNLKLSQH